MAPGYRKDQKLKSVAPGELKVLAMNYKELFREGIFPPKC
jgi:hypothetical protein